MSLNEPTAQDAPASLKRPSYDPELAALLQANPELGIPPLSLDRIEQIRAIDQSIELDALLVGRAIETQEYQAPGPEGSPDIKLLVLRSTEFSGPRPALYYIHGGGMVVGTRYAISEQQVDWVEQYGVTLVSVEYRLAPEHPHPAPVEDCYAGLVWTAAQAAELGLDPRRILLGGVSAGGGLAAAVTLLARDRQGPALVGQLLACPMLDHRNVTVSSQQYSGLGQWDRESNELGWSALLGDDHHNAEVSPYASPALATDLSELPSTYLDNGSAEVFRDEGVDYVSRLWAAGVQAELHIWAGAFHGSEGFSAALVSKAAHDARDSWVRRILDV
ncbi:alpha/beta hydrolase [Psychromicrobium lacuslunae]|uniref:Esterase n=1 Tax=Psychromicrobium lacuslunae TaxID=1618207 RepID=A0A0D4C0F8_9MICC|nr:alpha/beta hydrolase [Psychromicrobium lacuslunae]AJT42024.1 esterase [Psychromicrobium lacuslunae]